MEKTKNLENLWQSIPIPICQTDNSLMIIKYGIGFQKMFNCQRKLIGFSLAEIFAEKKDFEKLKKDINGKINRREVFLLSQNKRKFLGAVYANPFQGGYIFSFLDVSDKKKIKDELQTKIEDLQRITQELKNSRSALLNILEDMEEARTLAETERDKTLAIIENFPEGLLFFNQENKLISVNPKIQDLFSLSPNALEKKGFEELSNIPSFKPIITILGKNIKTLLKKEIEIRDGLVLEISSIPISREGEKIGTLVILRDITREKVVEKLKTEFVSIAAHQLRTPLSAIKWTLEMMLDGDMGEISEEQRGFLKKTYQSNERMIRLINDLLNVTRIEEGRFLYKTKKCDIIELAENVLAPLKEVARRKGIKVITDWPKKKIPKVEVDTEKISLVIQNLVDNAINYTKKGGEIKITIDYHKEEIIFSVKDNGIGISDSQKKRIFSKFFRGDNAVRAETEGTGLGLYIAKNIIEAHKGKIWFESEENKGTTFFFSLPI